MAKDLSDDARFRIINALPLFFIAPCPLLSHFLIITFVTILCLPPGQTAILKGGWINALLLPPCGQRRQNSKSNQINAFFFWLGILSSDWRFWPRAHKQLIRKQICAWIVSLQATGGALHYLNAPLHQLCPVHRKLDVKENYPFPTQTSFLHL